MGLVHFDRRPYDELYAAFRWPTLDAYNIATDVCDKWAGDPDRVALIDAAPAILARFPEVRFIVAGDGDRLGEVADLARRVNQRLGREHVFVPGGRTDAPDLLRAADVVVGVARVALEAMATGKPVVIAGEGGLRGVLDADNAALMMACNFTGRGSGRAVTAGELARLLLELLDAPDRRTGLGLIGRELVERFFSIERVADQVEAVYAEVCEG